MSQDNVEIVRRGWEAFERGDVEAAFETLAPDVEWDVSADVWGDVVGGGVYTGLDGVRRWMADLFDAWETFEMSVGELVGAGPDQVVGGLVARGRGRVSGAEVEHRPGSVSTVRGGKVVRVVWFPSLDEARAAAGLSG